MRATTVPGVEEPERFLRGSHQNPSNNQQTGRIEIGPQERGPLLIGDKPERDASFCVFADQVITEEQPANIETAPVPLLASEQLSVRDAVAGIPVHVEEAVYKLVLETQTANQKGVDNRLFGSLGDVSRPHRIKGRVLTGVHRLISDAAIDNPGFIAPKTVLVKSEQQRLVAEQANIENRYRQFVEVKIEMNLHPVLPPSEGSDRSPTDISDDKRNPRAYSI